MNWWEATHVRFLKGVIVIGMRWWAIVLALLLLTGCAPAGRSYKGESDHWDVSYAVTYKRKFSPNCYPEGQEKVIVQWIGEEPPPGTVTITVHGTDAHFIHDSVPLDQQGEATAGAGFCKEPDPGDAEWVKVEWEGQEEQVTMRRGK